MAEISRRQILAALGGAALQGRVLAAAESPWPSRPIRMLVPSAGGSGADLMCRLFSDQLSQALGQPVVVDNKPGANGILAADLLVHQPGDGYTLGWLSSSSTVINQALQPKLPFDVTTDLVPVVQVGAGGIHLVVAPDFPAKNLAEFVAVVKARPADTYDYGSWGIGSTGHLMMEWLKAKAGLQIRHVPYKTVPQIYQDLQGGNIQIAWVDASSSVPLIKAGKLRGIAMSASRRGPQLPDLPTLTEQGYRFEADAWYGVFAPKGTPAPVVAAVNRHIRAALLAPALESRRFQLNLSQDTPQRSPEEFAQVVRQDLKVWQAIVRENGIRIEG
ncbi:tripartite tricarboxylate transporter substrate binding protein [Variovorax sp. OV329]|uniref:Bug family tripartite tricarboxylate transporter substrate binding protein n=1 Tax=Variovorax sp. OV329 TaxID=1882825 RepID=UPI0020C83E0A|nr:tripartite tricarboxylate transporter substrate binding protein [Variovorax sp. OV329]